MFWLRPRRPAATPAWPTAGRPPSKGLTPARVRQEKLIFMIPLAGAESVMWSGSRWRAASNGACPTHTHTKAQRDVQFWGQIKALRLGCFQRNDDDDAQESMIKKFDKLTRGVFNAYGEKYQLPLLFSVLRYLVLHWIWWKWEAASWADRHNLLGSFSHCLSPPLMTWRVFFSFFFFLLRAATITGHFFHVRVFHWRSLWFILKTANNISFLHFHVSGNFSILWQFRCDKFWPHINIYLKKLLIHNYNINTNGKMNIHAIPTLSYQTV